LEIKFSSEVDELNKLTIKKIFVFIRLGIQLGRRIKKFAPDFVYFTIKPAGKGFYRDIFFVLLIKALRAKPIYVIHSQGIKTKIENRVLKTIYNLVFSNSIIIHLSKGLLQKEIAPLGPINSKLFFVESGIENVNVSNFIKKEDSFVYLLFLSNIFTSKGIFVLLEAFNTLSSKFDNIRLVIIGNSGSEKIDEKINSFISKNSLKTKIEYCHLKSSDEKHQFLRNADIFVLPTLNDTFPLVLLEAMQFGLPVISTFEGGIPEIVEDHITGFLVKQNDVQGLAEKIEILIGDDNLRKKMGEKGRQKFLNEFTLEKFEHRMGEVFNAL
jgi:glycosyltransferase involved in cell wall biosynthesis